jgi:hypothetical protein
VSWPTTLSIHDEAVAAEADAKIARAQRVDNITRQFESLIGELAGSLSSASTELEASAGTLTKTAENTQELSTMFAAASEEASTNVQSVASAGEEMASTVNENGRQVQESARIAGAAVEQAQKTSDRVKALSPAAARIGDVVDLINTIAGQTNLLALNATIEAARTGEAGRGSDHIGGQGARRANCEGHGRDRSPDCEHPGGDAGLGGSDLRDQGDYRPDLRSLIDYCISGRRAGRCDAGDLRNVK